MMSAVMFGRAGGGRLAEEAVDRLDGDIIEEDRGPAAGPGVGEGHGVVAGGEAEGGRAVPGPGALAARKPRQAPSDSPTAVPPSMEMVSPWNSHWPGFGRPAG